MKNAIFTFLTITLLIQHSYSQSETDFVNFDNQWNLASGSGGYASTNKYRFDEDSITINNLVYYTMEYSIEELSQEWIPYEQAAFRQEGKKVYQLTLFDSTEVLLYDFGLEVGDTLLGAEYIGEPDLTVIEIDSILLEDGSLRKQLHLISSNSCIIQWVEGLGSIVYAFNSAMYTCFTDVGTTLICFSQNETPLFYENEEFFGCWYESQPPPPNLISFSTRWNIYSQSQSNGDQSTVQLRFIDSPIIINNYNYYQMERSNEENGGNWTTIESYAFRSNVDEVFLLNTTDSTEVLIHDFGLTVGDTFVSKESLNDPGTEMVVIKVDTIQLLDGRDRKRITLDCGFEVEWVQGIGNMDYPLAGTVNSCYFDVPGQLLCFYSGGDIVYEGLNNIEGCWVTDIEEIPESEINIYPNPITDLIFIEAETPVVSAKIFNLNGELVLEKNSSNNIAVDQLNSGMYILHLVNDKGEEISKRVVVE